MSSWIVEALIASSLLMLLVLILRRPVADHFGPRLAYWLWLLPALRMVLPPIPQDWFEQPVSALPEITTAFGPHIALVHSPANWLPVIAGFWAAGAAGHFALHLWAYRRFATRAINDAQLLEEIDPGAIRVLATSEVAGPLAMGLLRPTILVPQDFSARFDEDERTFALAHEVAHHRRGDLKINLVALALLSLHWFNPLAHWAYRAFRTDQELACDATIMADADADQRHAYGRALVKSAMTGAPLVACALNRKQELIRRIKMMRFGRPSGSRSALATGLGVVLVSGGMLITASVGARAAAETEMGQMVQASIDEGSAAVVQSVASVEAEMEAAEVAVEAEADAERNKLAAERDALAAATDAEMAARDAQTRAGKAETAAAIAEQQGKKEAAFAEREAAFAQRQADFAARKAALAERRASLAAERSRLRTWPQTAPVPPTPPTPPVPPVATSDRLSRALTPLAPLAPPQPPKALACDSKSKDSVERLSVSADGRQSEVLIIRRCNGRANHTKLIKAKAMMIALHTVRQATEHNPALTNEQRQQIIEQMEKAREQLSI